MTVVLNVKVGDRLTFRAADGTEHDAKVIEFPKIIRVQTDDGAQHDVTPEQVIAEGPKKTGANRLPNRFQPRI